MKIGNVAINGIVGLAPMAGVADRAFREMQGNGSLLCCKRNGKFKGSFI